MARRSPHLLLVTTDFLRADALSCHGHPRSNTWYLDRLAREGVRFAACHAASPLTRAARASLLASVRPDEHQVLADPFRLGPGVPTLLTALGEAGWTLGLFGRDDVHDPATAARVFEEAHEVDLDGRIDLSEGVHAHSAFSLEADHPMNVAATLTGEALAFLARHPDRPAAAWLSLSDPGPAYCCPPPYDFLFSTEDHELPPGWPEPPVAREPARAATWRHHAESRRCREEHLRKLLSIYLGQVRLVDDQIGRALRELEKSGDLDHTWIAFVSSHGDLLGYRGLFQNPPLFYEPLVRVPFLVRPPGRGATGGDHRGRAVEGLVSTLDVAPTLLGALGVAPPPTMVGRSFWNDLQPGTDPGRESVVVLGGVGAPTAREPVPELHLRRVEGCATHGPGAMIRKGSWKLSLYADDVAELCDLETDPHELHNRYEDVDVIDVREELTRDLARELLAAKLRGAPGPWPVARHPVDVRSGPLGAPPPPPVPAVGRRRESVRRPLAAEAPGRRRRTAPVKLTRVPFASAIRPTKRINHVVFVSTTNQFRSRFAEALFNYYANVLNLRWSASSRGLAIERAVGADLSPIVVDALVERDIPVKHAGSARQSLVLDDLHRADRIVALDETEVRPLLAERFRDWADRVEYWNVPPPSSASSADVLHAIDEQVGQMLRALDQS